MNRTALRLAREVADKTGTLVAGDICNTNAFNPKVPSCRETVKNMFKVGLPFSENNDVFFGFLLVLF